MGGKKTMETLSKGISGEIIFDNNDRIKAWQDLQFGMFIHIGLYSELGGVWKGDPIKKGYSEQIQMWADIPEEEYMEVAARLTLENFDPQAICTLAKRTGMKYIVVTSKHHDGFCMFDTKTTDYNIVKSTPFGKDLLKMLSDECRRQDLGFGVYFSLVDWHLGHEFDYNNNNAIPATMEPVIEEQLKEVMTNYGAISEVWFDMSSPSAEQSSRFSEVIRRYQPDAAINGRIWNNKGDFRTLDDNQIPTENLDGAWQTPASIYHATWGYRSWQERNDIEGKVRDLLECLISVRARGGNYLLNIGPRGDGSVVEFEAEVLTEIGEWISRHPDAVLGTNPTRFGQQPWGEITARGKQLFLHVIKSPDDGKIVLPGLVTDVERIVEDGSNRELHWIKKGQDIEITLPDQPWDELVTTVKVVLAGDLYLLPSMVIANSDKEWELHSADLEKGYNFMDDGNYTSLSQSNVRLSAYLYNSQEGQAFVEIEGEVNPGLFYSIQLGPETKIVSGDELINTKIGPFTIDTKDEIIPIHIKLDRPAHKYQDLDVRVDTITIKVETNRD